MMDAIHIATSVAAALERGGIPHMFVGSFARNFHAFARSTNDLDIVVSMDRHGLERFLAELGPDFGVEPRGTFETNTGTLRHTVVHRQSAFQVEVFLLSNDPFDHDRFRRRLPIDFNGHRTFVLTAEDVVVSKLCWSRPKDLEDVRDVLSIEAAAMDWDYLHHWTGLHGTRARLDELRASIPPVD